MTIPVLDPYYRVEVDAGPLSWASEKGDVPGYGLADPLRIGWSLPNDNPLFHAQADPMTAAFSVVVASLADVAAIGRGAPVVIRVYGWPPGTANPHAEATDLDPVNYPPIAIFRGRVANVDANTHKLGMVVTYGCVDYTVDLSESPPIGAGDWPEESNDDRLERMFAEAGVPTPVPWFVSGGDNIYFGQSFNVRARAGSPADARALIYQLTDWATDNPDIAFPRYQYVTTSYAAGFLDGEVPDPAAPYAIPFAAGRVHSGDTGQAPRLPGVLAQTQPGKWGVDIVEDAGRRAAVISADHVDFSARWSQSKATAPDTITVTGDFIGPGANVAAVTVAAPNPVPIGATLPCDANALSVAESYAEANLRVGDSDQWTADAFTWYADQDPWPLIADGCWFIEGLHAIASRYPVVIDGIDPTKTPNGLDWYAGRLRSATFTLQGGRYTVTFELQRSLLRPEVFSSPSHGVATLSWDDLAAGPSAGATWNDLDPAHSWFDARLLRSA